MCPPLAGSGRAAIRSDSTRSRSREGSSRCSFTSARTDASPIPSTLADVAVRNAIATDDRLVVVQEHGRHRDRLAEAVSARDARARLDGVSEPAQAIDVVAHGPGRDFESLGERRPRPIAPHLQSDSRRRSLAEVSSIPPRSHELRKEAFRIAVLPWIHRRCKPAQGPIRRGDADERHPALPHRHRGCRPRRPAGPTRPHALVGRVACRWPRARHPSSEAA